MTIERRTSKQVLAIAKTTIEAIANQVAHNRSTIPGITELSKFFLQRRVDGSAPEHLRHFIPNPGPLRSEYMAACTDTAIFSLWEKSKVVYAMDDLLLHYLSESSTDRVPTALLEELPHADPFVLLPKPDFTDEDTQYYRTHIGVPMGAFLFGRYRNGTLMCSTRDEYREDIGVWFVGFIEQQNKRVITQTLRCTIPLDGKETTVEDVIDRTIERFHFSDDLQESDHTRLEAWLRRYVTQVFNSLLYVCSDEPDVEATRPGNSPTGKAKKPHKQRRPRPDDINTLVKIGFRLGPALRAAETRQRESRSTQDREVTGRRLAMHRKGLHYRTYHTGPGGAVPKIKLIKPFWVNVDLPAPETATVRPVRKR